MFLFLFLLNNQTKRLIYCSKIFIQYETEIDSSKNNKAYGSQPNVLWFGPRPGRKKRNLRPNNSYQNSDMEKEQLNALINALQDSPWTILAVNGIYYYKQFN